MMPGPTDENQPLPGFRQDLRVYPGPEDSDGSPTYNLQDPIRAKFFQFTWSEYLIFERLQRGITLQQLMDRINNTTTLRVSNEQVTSFLTDCGGLGLLDSPISSEYIHAQKKRQTMSWFVWLLYTYLFMRFPLFNPDVFLTRTLKYVRFLGSNTAFMLYAAVASIGLLFLALRLGEFINSFSFFFNLEGFVDYFIAISLVKIIHEMSHAYSAKRYGLYVPSMGIALIVLWPVLYTDVTDGWKIRNRRHRIYVSAAGIIAETIIAGACTIGWALTHPGVLNNIFFVVASVTWISTLVINLNPAIRFDGYYILSDLWGVDNLQPRTFAVTRWKLREWCLGVFAPCPEPRLARHQLITFMSYALYTIVYRLFLYTAIALFIYHTFTKALGIFLFFVEIGIFIIWPIVSEIQQVKHMKEKLTFNPRLLATLSVGVLILGWAVVPLPHTETFSGVVVPLSQQTIYVPADSLVREVFVQRDQTVKAGKLLIKLESPGLIQEMYGLKRDRAIVRKQLDLMALNDSEKSHIPSKEAELATIEEKLQGIEDLEDRLNVKATVLGKLYEWNQIVRSGIALPKDFVLGKIADPKNIEVIFFVPEELLNTVSVGEPATFKVPSMEIQLKGIVSSINPVRPQFLEYPALASIYKGEVAVNQEGQNGRLKIIKAYYTVHLSLEDRESLLFFGTAGEVKVRGPWRSKLVGLVEEVMRILWREGSL